MIEPIFSSILNLLRQTYQSLIWMGVAAFMLTSSTAPRIAAITGDENGGPKSEENLRIKSPSKAPSMAGVTNWLSEEAVILP